MLFQLNVYRSQKEGGGSHVGAELERSQRLYLGFLENKCNNPQAQALPIYVRVRNAQNSIQNQFSDYLLASGSKYTFAELWSPLNNVAGKINIYYAGYLLLASDLRYNKYYEKDATLHNLANAYDILAQKVKSGTITESDVAGPIANILLIASRLNPNLKSSAAFSCESITDVKNLQDAISILKAGVEQIENANIPASVQEGHEINMADYEFVDRAISAYFLAGSASKASRPYARLWITGLGYLDELLMYNAGAGKGGLLHMAVHEFCEKSEASKKDVKDASSFDFANSPFTDAQITAGDAAATQRSPDWQVRGIIKEMEADGTLSQLFSLFGESEDTKIPNSDPNKNNILNFALNQMLSNSLRDVSFRYYSSLILSAQGNSTDVQWDNANGQKVMKDLLDKATNPLSPFSFPVGKASHEFLAIPGYEKEYEQAARIIDAFCLKHDMLKLVYTVDTPGQYDANGFFVPDGWEVTTDAMSGQNVVVPSSLKPFIENGKLTSKANTRVIYNLMPGEEALSDQNMVSINDLILWLRDPANKISQSSLSASFGGQKLLSTDTKGNIIEGDAIVSVSYYLQMPDGSIDFDNKGEFSSEKEALDAGYVPYFYLKDESAEENFNKFIVDRKTGTGDSRNENSSHPLVPFLSQQRGLQIHTNSYNLVELMNLGKNLQTEEIPPNPKTLELTYTGISHITPTITADKSYEEGFKITFGHDSDVTLKDESFSYIAALYNQQGVALAGYERLKGAKGKFSFPAPERPEGLEEFFEPTTLNTSISHSLVQTESDPVGADGEVATFSYQNGSKATYYLGAKMGQTDPDNPALSLGVTGSGGLFMHKYASTMVGSEPFAKIDVPYVMDRKFAVVKVPPEDKFEPGGWVSKPPRASSLSAFGEVTPGPKQWLGKKIVVPYGQAPGDFMFHLTSHNTDFPNSPFVNESQTQITKQTPIQNTAVSFCVFGYDEGAGGKRNFYLLPCAKKGERVGTDLLALTAKEDGEGRIQLYASFNDGKEKMWVGTATGARDGGYTFELSLNISKRKLDILSAQGSDVWEHRLAPYVLWTQTDEYGAIFRNGTNKDGTPKYETITYNQAGMAEPTPAAILDAGRIKSAKNSDDLKNVFSKLYGDDFEQSFPAGSFEADEGGGIDRIIQDKDGTRFRLRTEEFYSGSDLMQRISIYDADCPYQQFLSLIEDASSQFYFAPGGIISPDMPKMGSKYDEAAGKFILSLDLSKLSAQDGAPAGEGEVPLIYYNLSATGVHYEIINPGVGTPLWGPLLHLSDEQKVQKAAAEGM
ncbi:hypothetical protein COU37_05465 [Candidatus Micrarchaeota archaeon CG10_big_fil_rev_8_21_14_0_10_45_29]|nr:MAG: hypothetical protein COU37_05465 [Candidatus Micrarchaeota archaeon CG10_big_fil_rev_8_21_14_0_10_45_29]